MADDGHLASPRHLETHILENASFRLVGKTHSLEGQAAFGQGQGAGIRRVPDFRLALQQLENKIHVRQSVLDLAIDDAQKPQGNEQLQQKGVHQHQITDAHVAPGHPPGGEHHDESHAHGNDRPLGEIQQGHGSLTLHRPVFPVPQLAVETVYLQLLIAEVLHRFIVDETVHGPAVGLRVQPVHVMAEIHAPLRDGEGHQGIDHHSAEGDKRKHRIILGHQNPPHQQELHQHRKDTESHVVKDLGHGTGAPLQITADAAGLAFQVVAQGQTVQMLQHPGGEPAHGPVTHLGKDDVPQLIEKAGGQLQGAITQQQAYGQNQHLFGAVLQGIDDLLEQQGNPHIGHFGKHQAQQGKGRPPAELPEKRQHIPQVVPVAAILVHLGRHPAFVNHAILKP